MSQQAIITVLLAALQGSKYDQIPVNRWLEVATLYTRADPSIKPEAGKVLFYRAGV